MSGTWSSKRKRKLVADLMKRYSGRCVYCFEKVTVCHHQPYNPFQATVDHIIPRAKGGGSGLDNVVLACRACNEAKGDGPAPLNFGRVGQLDGHLNSNQDDAGSSPAALANTEAAA